MRIRVMKMFTEVPNVPLDAATAATILGTHVDATRNALAYCESMGWLAGAQRPSGPAAGRPARVFSLTAKGKVVARQAVEADKSEDVGVVDDDPLGPHLPTLLGGGSNPHEVEVHVEGQSFTLRRVRVLRFLLVAPGLEQYLAEIAKAAGMATPNAHKMLAKMEGLGWLSSEKLGRRRLFRLTREGERFARAIDAVMQERGAPREF